MPLILALCIGVVSSMSSNELLLQAIRLALDAHGDQLDKAGMPYILHPLHVMNSVDSIDAKIVAVLHDVIEDTKATFLFSENCYAICIWFNKTSYNFPPHILEALAAISKIVGETNKEYWIRVKANPLALRVKLADIGHNSSEERLNALPPEEATYLRTKYAKALKYLTS